MDLHYSLVEHSFGCGDLCSSQVAHQIGFVQFVRALLVCSANGNVLLRGKFTSGCEVEDTNKIYSILKDGFNFKHFKLTSLSTQFLMIGVGRSIMDNQSSLEFDSDESDLDLQAENYEENGKMEDDLQKNLDFCVNEDEKMAEQSGGSLSLNADLLEPYVGMEFNSRDEAREFYAAYGGRIGFTIRIHHNRRSRVNNQVIGQDFVCSKEGFRAKKYIYRKDSSFPTTYHPRGLPSNDKASSKRWNKVGCHQIC
ncbi:hypothetical protein CRYUN_Cryun29cG0017000 [Craigia yunnanensis]